MGHTPTGIIPLGRAHLHFEIGLIANADFGRWFRAQRLKPDHGMFNGWNLQALDPLAFFDCQQRSSDFAFGVYLAQVPRAFELLCAAPTPVDFFRRYPGLWKSEASPSGAIVMACSANGTPLEGRLATEPERAELGRRKAVVLTVHEDVLGRNGCRLIARERGGWKLGSSGERWLEILTYP